MACCAFVGRKWLEKSSLAQLRYRELAEDEEVSENSVTVIVGKEKRVFVVDPFVLEKDPFRILLQMARKKSNNKKNRELNEIDEGRAIFVNVDSILFEHMLWLMYNDCSSFLQLNLSEIIEFYAQDT